MKTLDEVIELCEKALWCAYLPQDDTTTTAGLALYYLREYREMKEHLACLDAVALHGEDTQRVNNPALTWEELQGMEGQPVWVEEPAFWGSRWVIISGFNEEAVFGTSVGSQVFFCRDRQGVEWQAYRKERE